jgi:hypothetical protein
MDLAILSLRCQILPVEAAMYSRAWNGGNPSDSYPLPSLGTLVRMDELRDTAG